MGRLALLALLLASAGCAGRRGEIAVSGYLGGARHAKTDLELRQPGGTDVRLLDVPVGDGSLDGPIHWGVRGAYWFPPAEGDPKRGAWGLLLDFVHAKAFPEEGRVVRQEGTRGGAPVSGRLPVGDTIGSYELSHGYNLLTLSLLRRWLPAEARGVRGRLRPYAGAGGGVAVPHVEATVGGVRTEGYQLAGYSLQGLAGVDVAITGSLSTFVEYRLGWADIGADLEGGGSIRHELLTHHVAVGLTWRF